jgi:hypothetical protein
MEKDIDRIQKNPDTEIVIRIDDFGGKRGLTIREFINGERYTGFTKAGTRIPADKFKIFKDAINSIDEKELLEAALDSQQSMLKKSAEKSPEQKENHSKKNKKIDSIDEQEM